MAAIGCFARADLSDVRLIGVDAAHAAPWKPSPPAGDTPSDAIWWRAQAEAAAAYIADRIGPQREIAIVCIDARELSCIRLTTPSADPAVVAATFRQNSSELIEYEAPGLIQPLTDAYAAAPAASPWSLPMLDRLRRSVGGGPATPAEASASHVTVIVGADGLVRLWLDELDKRGVRIGVVTSLWHAIGSAWRPSAQPNDPDPGVDAVVVIEHERMVWAWSSKGRLTAGGAFAIPRRADTAPADDAPAASKPEAPVPDLAAAISRLTLDWLTWSAQLGEGPRRVAIVGAAAVELKALLRKSWADAEVTAVFDADPVGSAVRRLATQSGPSGAEGALSDEDPRASLVTLSRRRGRAHRRLYTAVGASLTLLAGAVGALGFARRQDAGVYRQAEEELRAKVRATVSEISPELAKSGVPVRALEAELERLRKGRPDIVDPARIKPVLEELERIVNLMGSMGDGGLNVVEINVQEGFPTARFTVPSFAVGEDFAARLRSAPGKIRWTPVFEKRDGDIFTYRLDGQWEPGA